MEELLQTFPLTILIILVLTQLLKGYIKPKFGNTGVQLFIALVSFIGAGLWITKDFFSPEILRWIWSLWITANGIYQVLYKWLIVGTWDKVKGYIVK